MATISEFSFSQNALVARDLPFHLTRTHARREKKVCLLCEGEAQILFDKDGHDICLCTGCDYAFADYVPPADHARRVYGENYFFGGGAGYPDYLREGKILRAHGGRYGRLLSKFMKPGKVLDVGAAAGFVLQGLQDCGWRGAGLEPNPRMAHYAREALGLEVKNLVLEEYQHDEQFDLINMTQVIAHFSDLRSALQNAARATKMNGFWLIETWNRASLVARVLGRNWHEFSPPSVLHWFSPTCLRQLLAQYGLREVAVGRPSKRLASGHAKTLLQYKLSGNRVGRVAARMLDLMPENIALPYPAWDLFWGLYQKVE